MDDYLHRTDTLNPRKVVIVGKQKTHWVEFQLLDELGEPLANMPYRAVSDATRAGCAPECAGHSDAHGVIRLEGLHPVDVTYPDGSVGTTRDYGPDFRKLQAIRLAGELK